MKNYRVITVTIISLLLLQAPGVLAQDLKTTLSPQEKSTVIDSIGNKLKEMKLMNLKVNLRFIKL